MIKIEFKSGTLELQDVTDDSLLPSIAKWDPRTSCYRMPASFYAELIMNLVKAKVPYDDQARKYEVLSTNLVARQPARPFQQEAIDAWLKKRQGVVVLPTGAGKTFVALLAIEAVARSALVVVPTIDLVRQWHRVLSMSFHIPVGSIGGGEKDLQPLTVITYDSAYLQMEYIGNRFGLIIFDECHHLPTDTYSLIALSCLAPYRLGLSATPERTDGKHEDLYQLIGPMVYRKDVLELAGEYLSAYTTKQVVIELTEEEKQVYAEEKKIYRDFVISQGIRMSSPTGWSEFIMKSARSDQGRRAMKAYLNQKRLAYSSPSKINYVGLLLELHDQDKILLFTQDNASAYEVAQKFLIPVITHQTKGPERKKILDLFSQGVYRAIATSKVLNEGVDVPDANVAIVISGTGSVREHVQRLGRILRRGDQNKKAILYELIANDTSEAYISARRREHNAYR